MANIKAHAGAINLDNSAPIEETFVDNGDGTYARLVETAGTVADGADVAQGATTDASSASTVIGLLKNLKAALAGILSVKIDQTTPGSTNAVSVTTLPALPTGTNTIGRITIADGGDATVGTTTDASSASTLVGLLKNLKAALAGKLATTVADGDNAAIGATTDASSALTLVGLLKNIKAALAGIIAVKIDQTTPGTTNAVESNHYGTPSAGASVSVGTGSTPVLGANAARKFLALCNDSANTIYVDLSGGTAVLSKGVRLNAAGGSVVLDRYVPISAITAIASAASSVLTIQEG